MLSEMWWADESQRLPRTTGMGEARREEPLSGKATSMQRVRGDPYRTAGHISAVQTIQYGSDHISTQQRRFGLCCQHPDKKAVAQMVQKDMAADTNAALFPH